MVANPQNSVGAEPSPGFSGPHEEAVFNLIRTADWLHRAIQQRTKRSGLTATQYNVLRILRGAPPTGLTCSGIGSRMLAAEPDITRLLGRLKAQKLIGQHRDTQDRRVVWTRITASGLALLATLDGYVEQGPRELLRELSGEELRDLIRLLKKVRSMPGSGAQDRAGASLTGKPPLPRSLPPPRPE
jgi:DNA-binding MarR family transcriptional regulator